MAGKVSKNKVSSRYICQSCGAEHIRWAGKCSQCNGWNSITLEKVTIGKQGQGYGKGRLPSKGGRGAGPSSLSLVRLSEIGQELAQEEERISSGIRDLDQVLGGGIVADSLILLAGEPGVGKSTLMLEIARHSIFTVYYFSGEESVQQIVRRAQRMEIKSENLFISRETDLEEISACIEQKKPRLAIIDSIQTMYHSEHAGGAGNPSQLREAAMLLLETARQSGCAIFVTGHITKDGAIAGPRLLEHMVDIVLYFESDRTNHYRLLRAVKNRFGAVGELAVFEMVPKGMQAVSALPLLNVRAGLSGAVYSLILGGSRPLPVEVQALVSPSAGPPKRMTEGLDNRRLVLLAAVLEKYLKELKLAERDIFANLVGGFSSDEPALDLPQCLAILSSCLEISIPSQIACLGEVGLGGEVRPVERLALRVKELQNLGFQKVIVPQNNFIHVGGSESLEQKKMSGEEKTKANQSHKDLKIEIETIGHIRELLQKIQN